MTVCEIALIVKHLEYFHKPCLLKGVKSINFALSEEVLVVFSACGLDEKIEVGVCFVPAPGLRSVTAHHSWRRSLTPIDPDGPREGRAEYKSHHPPGSVGASE